MLRRVSAVRDASVQYATRRYSRTHRYDRTRQYSGIRRYGTTRCYSASLGGDGVGFSGSRSAAAAIAGVKSFSQLRFVNDADAEFLVRYRV